MDVESTRPQIGSIRTELVNPRVTPGKNPSRLTWFWTRKSESDAISLSNSRVAEVAEGFEGTGNGLGGLWRTQWYNLRAC